MTRKSEVFLSSNTGITQGHHRYFSSPEAATSFFRGKSFYSTDDINIVRSLPSKHGWNVSEVHFNLTMRALENAEYLSFLNKDVSSVWFHCKVLHVEYVNPTTTRVQFQIDYYATYIGYCELGYGFLERGHIPKSEDDATKFLVKEPFEAPLMETPVPGTLLDVINAAIKPDKYVFFASSNPKGVTNDASVRFRSLRGSETWGCMVSGDRETVDEAIKTYMNQTSSMQTIVKPFMDGVIAALMQPHEALVEDDKPYKITIDFVDATLPSVRNKKCYNPQFLTYKVFALSTGDHCSFNVLWANGYGLGALVGLPSYEMTCVLTGGIHGLSALYMDGSKVVATLGQPQQNNYVQQSTYPSLDIATLKPDQYTGWGVVKKLIIEPIAVGVATAVVAPELAVGAAAMKFMSNDAAIGDTARNYTTTATPSPAFAKAYDLYKYVVIRCSPSDHYFKVLDDFFDRWGYVVNETRKISLNVRSNFTYVKTSDCVITGKAPQIAILEISNMLNSGYTFWQVDIGSTNRCG